MAENEHDSSSPIDVSSLLGREGAIDFLSTIGCSGGGHASKAQLPEIRATELETLATERSELTKVDPRFFEELVAELLRADGFDEIQIVPRPNAPGPDIIAMCVSPFGHRQEVLVEVKRWKDAVGVDVVRNTMYRVDTEYRATSAIIVTTSSFTAAALEELRRFHVWRLALRDGAEVQDWIRKHAANISCHQASDKSNRSVSKMLSILMGRGTHAVLVYLRDCVSR